LDTALREDGGTSSAGRLDHDRTDAVLGFDAKTKTTSQNVLAFGEELQYWIDKVDTVYKLAVSQRKKHLLL